MSLSTWYARDVACRTASPGESTATWIRQCRTWRTSATFVGGANVVRTTPYDLIVNPGGRATFAITLAPGRYWFYSDSNGHPALPGGRSIAMSRIRTVTVVGAAERAAVPVAATARFATGSVTLPRSIPRRGFVLGVGEVGFVNALALRRLEPWVTPDQLQEGVCFDDGGGGTPSLSCFDGDAGLGGGVSGGASALWWYDLPPGEYIAYQGGLNALGEAGPLYGSGFAQVTVR